MRRPRLRRLGLSTSAVTIRGGAVAVAAMATSRRLGVASTWLFVAFAVAAWLGLYEGGVHPTLAGVATGLDVTPGSISSMRRPATPSDRKSRRRRCA